MCFNKKETPTEKFFREHLEDNGINYKEKHQMKNTSQIKIDAFPNLDDLSGKEKIDLYDRYTEEMKGFEKHLVKTSSDALKTLKQIHQFEVVYGGDTITDIHRQTIEKTPEVEEFNEDTNAIIIDSAMAEIKRLEDCNTDLRIKLSTIMTLTPAETLEIKSSKLYRKQRKKIKKFKSLVKKLNIEVFELRHMGDKGI